METGSSRSNETNFTIQGSRLQSKEFSVLEVALSSTLIIIIMILSLLGNMLVLLAFKRNRRIRTTTNFFVASLAVTDILVATIVMPFWVSYIACRITNVTAQRIWTWTDILCGIASIWHLTFISVDRYFCIVNPLKYHTYVTHFRAVVVIAGIWVYSIVSSSLGQEFWSWPGYTLLLFINNFAVPTAIILVMYFNIFRKARYQARQIDLTINGKSKRFFLSKEVKAAKTLAIVIGAFLITWAPFFALNLLYYVCRCRPLPFLVVMAKWMHYGNSMSNPFIYGVFNKDFKSEFKKILVQCFSFVFKKGHFDNSHYSRSEYSRAEISKNDVRL